METSSDQQRIGNALRVIRLVRFSSQDAFADHIKMHRAYYGSIERGKLNITLSTLVRVCNGLGVKPSEVLRKSGL
jgi:transcriptional regulator with XRE-family HTH domain